MVEAVSVTSCSASDLQCLCTNSAYISKAVNCIAEQCDSTDAQNSYAYATYACNSAGVQVPSVASVLSSSAPAPAPAPAAATAPPSESSSAPEASTPAASTAEATPSTSATAVVTFQGSSASRVEKGMLAAVVFGVVAIFGARML